MLQAAFYSNHEPWEYEIQQYSLRKSKQESEHLIGACLAHFPQDKPRLGIFKLSEPEADDPLDYSIHPGSL